MPKRAALCLRPDGMETVAEVKAAVRGRRRAAAGAPDGWSRRLRPRRRCARLPISRPSCGSATVYEAQLAAAEREGDPGALACLRGNKAKVHPFDAASFSNALTRRATLSREWMQFLERAMRWW